MNRTKRLITATAALTITASAALAATTLSSANAAGTCNSVGQRGGAEAYSCPIWLPKDERRVPVYDAPGGREIDHLYEGGTANWFWCKAEGPVSRDYGYSSTSWAKTMGDGGKTGWVPANYLDAQASTWDLPNCGGGAPAPKPQPQPQPDDGNFYLPMAKGVSTTVTQGPWGSFSHNNANNYHAIDLGLPHGTPIHATGSGTIRVAGDRGDGYGNTVYVDHGNNRCSQFAHLSSVAVQVGQQVPRGTHLGNVGSTGQSTGPHLHWNIVACDGYLSLDVPWTVEQGKSYPEGAVITSQNPTN